MCREIGPFIASIPNGPFSVRERWVNPRTGERTKFGWRDWLWVMSGIADDDPSLEDQCKQLFDEVSEKAGGDASQNEDQWRSTAGRKARRLAAGDEVTTVGTLVLLATELGWTGLNVRGGATLSPVAASGLGLDATSSSGGSAGWTAAHELQAFKVAKSRLHDAFKVAQILGRHRIRGALVRVALTVREPAVRARLMFALAALLLKSNHSPEEIVEAIIACGFPRTHSLNAFLWAQKNVREGATA